MARNLEKVVSKGIGKRITSALAGVVAGVGLAMSPIYSGCGPSNEENDFPFPNGYGENGQVCQEGQRRCDGDDILVCNNLGEWWNAATCEYGCVEGHCIDNPGAGNGTTPGNGGNNGNGQEQICSPGEKTCEGDSIIICNEDGSAWNFVENCSYGCTEGRCWERIGEGTFEDSRDGRVYDKVRINRQWWMAENLDYEGVDSRCFFDDEDYCNNYGRLYQGNFALIACPSGWRLPGNSDWDALINYLGGYSVAGGKMKSTTDHWEEPNVGATNESGFTALPGGSMMSETIGIAEAFFWSANFSIYYLYHSREDIMRTSDTSGERWNSVRCIKE